MTGYRRFFFCFVLFFCSFVYLLLFFTFTEQEDVKDQTEAEISRLDP